MNNMADVVVEEELWNSFNLQAITDTAFHGVVKALHLSEGPYELSVLACNDARIAALNAEFRGKDAPTNVLSWPGFDLRAETPGQPPNLPPLALQGETHVNIGDIAIAYQTCMQEADRAGIEPEHHIMHLIIHGILHLLGYDHETNADADMMEKLETELLASMAIGNPYKNV